MNATPYPFVTDQAIGSQVALGVFDTEQCLLNDNYSFSGWSNGGPFVPGVPGPSQADTVIAMFAGTVPVPTVAEHFRSMGRMIGYPCRKWCCKGT